MDKSDWAFEVLDKLSEFATENDLPALKKKVEATFKLACQEILAKERAEDLALAASRRKRLVTTITRSTASASSDGKR